MKFDEFVYERPELKSFRADFERFVGKLEKSKGIEAAVKAVRKINVLRSEFESMQQIAYIRHTIDTRDEYYKGEQEFFDKAAAEYDGLVNGYYNALCKCEFKQELEDEFGSQLLRLARLKTRIYSDSVLENMKSENSLCTRYTKLLASAGIEFDGKRNTLSQMRYYQMSLEREVRKEASKARYAFFEENEMEFSSIYDRLVKLRNDMAIKLGYESFTGLGYDRMGRTDYTPRDVQRLREAVKRYMVPLCTRIRKSQAKRLGIESVKYYDEPVQFKDGNARLVAGEEEMLKGGIQMYSEMSKEAGDFFGEMVEKGLMDLQSKEGKSPGGYCTYIASHKCPFIFSNFNGTTDDVDVLTHEAGHAFQMHMSRNFEVVEYSFPTLDACEIHSMSMEFMTWPWMEKFFGNDADKYRLSHISESILFIPYGVLVDEFQHEVYENPGMSEYERKKLWRRLEKEYIPERDYDGNEFLESGTYWYQQGHIFKNPFYYIDYVLAGLCAIQFLQRFQIDRESAWKDYEKLCKAGGSMSFMDIVRSAGLDSPFEEETIRNAALAAGKIIYENEY